MKNILILFCLKKIPLESVTNQNIYLERIVLYWKLVMAAPRIKHGDHPPRLLWLFSVYLFYFLHRYQSQVVYPVIILY